MRSLIWRRGKPTADRAEDRPGRGLAEPPLRAGEPARGGPALSIAQRAAQARVAQGGRAPGAGSVSAAVPGSAPEGARPKTPKAPKTRARTPGPSRVSYKLQRLWLTPVFRLLMRVGLPLAIAFVAVFTYLEDPSRKGALTAGIMDLTRSVKSRPEFMIRLVAIEGATPEVAQLIRETYPIALPVSSFDLDMELLQAEISELDVVKSAALRIRSGGVLEIAVTQREPVAMWRGRAGLILLDMEGNQIAALGARSMRPDLPLLAGEGASDQVAEALALFRAARPLAPRLRGLVRIGQRRWDLALTGGQTIKLPEINPVAALQQVIALDEAQDLLARAVTTIDMRNPLRPTLRLAPVAQAEMRRIKAIELGDPS